MNQQSANRSPQSSRKDAALAFARMGWAVFPLAPGTKIPPKGSNGFQDATTDLATITAAFDAMPNANIGLPTGLPNGVFVVDCDLDPDKAKNGLRELRRLEKQHGALPKTRTVMTPRDGRHLYFKMPDRKTIKSGADVLAPGIDIRGDGGYVVAPGSTVNGKAYKVINSHEPADAPAWLIEAARKGTSKPKADRATAQFNAAENVGRLDLAKLENIHERPDGSIKAACPACRAAGEDRTGDHLLIKPDGKFGCAKYADDGEHRRQIWKVAGAKSAPPQARRLSELVRPQKGHDPDELLSHRYVCRGGGLLLCGPTGIGKSSLAMQCAIRWALGRECLGIRPTRPLKSLIIQAENDDGDLAEMRDGVIAGLGLTTEEAKTACENILVVREDSRTGFDFFLTVVRPLLEMNQPDLLWIDPALAYLGGEASAQKDVTAFLRNHLNPLLREFNCGALIVHHTNKPPTGREKSKWSGNEFAYLGTGSIEWANWARAILALRSLGSHEVFELIAAKRGSRLGWKEADGSTSYAKLIAHAKERGVICWREVDPDEIETGGRPKSYDVNELVALLPDAGLSTGDWQKLAKTECGISESTFHRERRALVKAGRILKSKVTNKWQPIKSA